MGRRSTGKLVTTARSIPIRGSITKMVSTSCIARVLVMAAEDQKNPMVAYIDSASGFASEALRIISTIDGAKVSVATFCRGHVGGAATVLAAHGMKGFRCADPGAVFSFNFDQERSRHQDFDSFKRLLEEVLATDSGQSVDTVRQWLSDGVKFTSAEAKSRGLVDHVAAAPVLPAGAK